jgi:hypothetical protein
MNRKQIKAEHERLNKEQPFTKTESKQFNKKDQSMIRNIQILNKFNKKQAIKAVKAYNTTPKQTLKNLAKEHRARLKKYSSPQKPEVEGRIKPHGKALPKRTGDVLRTNRRETQNYLKTPAKRNTVNYDKIEKGSKKYIDASPYELRYGVNSKKSQAYRERNGLSAKYEGRIVR